MRGSVAALWWKKNLNGEGKNKPRAGDPGRG